MKRFTKTMAALGLAAVMGTGSAFISLADVTTSVNPVATSRKSGWVDVQNHWYYFDANGNPVKNQWIQDGNNRYWMQEDGEMSKQKWVYTEGQWYWVNAQGAQASNIWVEDGGSWYYMGGDGRMMTNTWLDYAGKWYYLTETGGSDSPQGRPGPPQREKERNYFSMPRSVYPASFTAFSRSLRKTGAESFRGTLPVV